MLLSYAVDRLSRNQNHIGVVFDEVQQAGAQLEFVTERFEDTAIGRFILAARAFIARWEPSGGDFLLHELGCPYAELGERHDEVCSLDLALIRATVGGEVTRERWRLDGDAACVFRIRPAGAC